MSELRRMVIDEVESVLKEFVVMYDRETHFCLLYTSDAADE